MSDSPPDVERRSIARNSAVMAAGTLFSRLSGYLRSVLLVATLGSLLHADLFNVANTIPNALYILLAGGVFNAVLVPQLVRALKNDEDAGAAYTSRIITLAAIFLGAVSVLLVVAAPWIVDLYFDSSLEDPVDGGPAGLGDRVRPVLPAAGLLLRDVRAGRAGAQRPRHVRPDDVGADRQQRDRDRDAAHLLVRLRPRRGRGEGGALLDRSGAAARARLDRRHRGPAAGAAAVPQGRRVHATARGSTSAAPAWATRCGWRSGRSSSWSSTR